LIIAVVLNYRTPDLTIAAVQSLRQSDFSASHIIVVDNASDDGSVNLIARHLPDVHLIAAAANDGFSAGCNIGIREALKLGAENVLLLNGDVRVPEHTVRLLTTALEANPGLGIVGPVIVSSEDDIVQSAGIRYSSTTGRMRQIGFGTRLDALASFDFRQVDGVTGCTMLIRRAVFERIGQFEEEYFFGFEDLDFCLRARNAGYSSGCVGGAIVKHVGNASIGRTSDRRIYFATRNHLLLTRRASSNRSPLIRWMQIATVLGFNLAHVLSTSPVRRPAGVAAFVRGAADFAAGRYRAR
jgi:GT2 family glycosyltransferase